MIIDCHGHYTTVPAGMRVLRALQISNMGRPEKGPVTVSNAEIRIRWLTDQDRKKIFEENAKRAYPRLAAALDARRPQNAAKS